MKIWSRLVITALILVILITSIQNKSSGGRSSGGRSSGRSSSFRSSYSTGYNSYYGKYYYSGSGVSGGAWWVYLIILGVLFIAFLSYIIALSCTNNISFCRALVAVLMFNCKEPARDDLGCCGREKSRKNAYETKNKQVIENQNNSQVIDPYQDDVKNDDQIIQVQDINTVQGAGGYPPMTYDAQQQNLQPIVNSDQNQPVLYGGFQAQQEMIQPQAQPIMKVNSYKIEQNTVNKNDDSSLDSSSLSNDNMNDPLKQSEQQQLSNPPLGNTMPFVQTQQQPVGISYVAATLL
ncbi:UNKNOWN [Stylonychia lemnae]|uniref:Transmembrane protein n=1 Tax=Stylonychia lemnae TaxID=5949 RepID=A0A078B1R9_STYLE|nr:UNKNOWN [Stylonychia lemnae]|eukprot:CDW88246.1 UNKNOWN [Stylonychia lemnae]